MAEEIALSGPDLTSEGFPIGDLSGDVPGVGHVDGKPVVVVKTAGGARCVGGACTHYGAPLGDGICVDRQLRCPWHHAWFDIESGEAVGAPALNPIPTYETEVRDGRVFVTGPGEARSRPAPPSSPDSVVIVGSGAAGSAAAEAIRRYGYGGPVTLVGEEAPVDRPNVSKDYLAGTAPQEWMPLRSADFYADADVDALFGERVVSIDRAGREIELASGRTIEYGALLLAPGAEPRPLPVEGADRSHVRYVRTLADSDAIISALDGTERAVVVGAGFIGLEVAASFRQRDVAVTVVAPERVPLGALIGEALGRFVVDLHREHGVEFKLETGVVRIDEGQVHLSDGTSLPAELVVVGIGVTPNTGLAEAAGLAVDDGILVDDRLRTNDPYIWAAGDAASYPGPDGIPVRIEHWVTAQRQGQAVARNMVGHDTAFTDPPFFWSQHYDVPINVSGFVAGWDEDVVVEHPGGSDALVAFRKAGTIRAVASIFRDRANLRAERAFEIGDNETLEDLVAGRGS